MVERVEKAMELIKRNNEPYIVWVQRNDEAEYIMNLLKGENAVEVRGCEKTEIKEQKLLGFAAGQYSRPTP
jgi:hypothetical protein